jgi:hypothetical protein
LKEIQNISERFSFEVENELLAGLAQRLLKE